MCLGQARQHWLHLVRLVIQCSAGSLEGGRYLIPVFALKGFPYSFRRVDGSSDSLGQTDAQPRYGKNNSASNACKTTAKPCLAVELLQRTVLPTY